MPFDTNVYAVCPVVIYNSVLENRSFVDHFFHVALLLVCWYAPLSNRDWTEKACHIDSEVFMLFYVQLKFHDCSVSLQCHFDSQRLGQADATSWGANDATSWPMPIHRLQPFVGEPVVAPVGMVLECQVMLPIWIQQSASIILDFLLFLRDRNDRIGAIIPHQIFASLTVTDTL